MVRSHIIIIRVFSVENLGSDIGNIIKLKVPIGGCVDVSNICNKLKKWKIEIIRLK